MRRSVREHLPLRALRWHARAFGLKRYGDLAVGAAKYFPRFQCRSDMRFLLIAAMPNSGTTALSKWLQAAPGTLALTPSGEGQWWLPELSAPGARWDRNNVIAAERLRAVWLSRVPRAAGDGVVVEKSPPNLCRLDWLRAALAPMQTDVLCLTREPFAVCASWAKRYTADAIERDWRPDLEGTLTSDALFYRALGDTYGKWAQLLVDQRPKAVIATSYEALTDDPAGFAETLRERLPAVALPDPGIKIAVKDYAPASLRNLNEVQRARLTPAQIAAIEEGLSPYNRVVAALGYDAAFSFNTACAA